MTRPRSSTSPVAPSRPGTEWRLAGRSVIGGSSGGTYRPRRAPPSPIAAGAPPPRRLTVLASPPVRTSQRFGAAWLPRCAARASCRRSGPQGSVVGGWDGITPHRSVTGRERSVTGQERQRRRPWRATLRGPAAAGGQLPGRQVDTDGAPSHAMGVSASKWVRSCMAATVGRRTGPTEATFVTLRAPTVRSLRGWPRPPPRAPDAGRAWSRSSPSTGWTSTDRPRGTTWRSPSSTTRCAPTSTSAGSRATAPSSCRRTDPETWSAEHPAHHRPAAGRDAAARGRRPALRRRHRQLADPAARRAATSGPSSTGPPAPSATSSCSPEAFGAVAVQRHPSGVVRIGGDFGVLRWDGLDWHHEPPVGDLDRRA